MLPVHMQPAMFWVQTKWLYQLQSWKAPPRVYIYHWVGNICNVRIYGSTFQPNSRQSVHMVVLVLIIPIARTDWLYPGCRQDEETVAMRGLLWN